MTLADARSGSRDGHTEQTETAMTTHKSKLSPLNLYPLYTSEEISIAILSLSDQIRCDYHSKKITIICVLKGAVIFCSDLIRSLSGIELDFIQVSSYEGTKSNNLPEISLRPKVPLKNKHVLIVEDIADTGQSLDLIQKYIISRKPKSLKTCVLLSKNKMQIKLDYVGFNCPDKFVVGYGMDYNEEYRNLKNICVLGF